MAITLSICRHPSPEWDVYVRTRPFASIYLSSGWSLLTQEVFGHQPHFLEARDTSGALCGVLPVVQQKSLLFGKFMTSVPFYNYGGALADHDSIALQMMEQARNLAQEEGCSYLEFRDAQPRPGHWHTRTDKVSMLLDLPPDAASLSKQLGSKLRSQIKRADRENPLVQIGGHELLEDFYQVFCTTMRDLGTPVYPRKFFHAILKRFPGECLVVVVYSEGVPVASGFLVSASGRAEVPWAACRSDAKSAGLNMRLYWELITAAIERGCAQFDFGRSTVNSGTYRFKKQWGAQPLQLYWHRWERNPSYGHAGNSLPERKLMRYATAIWQRLPLRLANVLGPFVSPSLPW